MGQTGQNDPPPAAAHTRMKNTENAAAMPAWIATSSVTPKRGASPGWSATYETQAWIASGSASAIIGQIGQNGPPVNAQTTRMIATARPVADA